MVVTLDRSGGERKWGPLSRINAWRAGSYWEEMDREVKIFLEKDGKRREVSAEKLVGKGGQRFWLKEMKPEPPQQPEEKRDDQPVAEDTSDESTTEDDTVTEVETPKMSEDEPDEREIQNKMWLAEKATTLEKENTELKRRSGRWRRDSPSRKMWRG